ncbi:MAG: carboxypeptidase-like regulatory domain-containing protein [Angelakisella sp.]
MGVNIIAEQRHVIPVMVESRVDCTVTQSGQYCCINGTVTNCCGDLLKGVCVKALSANYQPIAHTMTDCGGMFTLILRQRENIRIVLSKCGYATLQLCNVSDCVKVCLEKQAISCLLSGRVVYANGCPAAPVRIQLVNSTVNRCVFSKPDGSFLFTRVKNGKYTLTISGNACKEKSLYVSVAKGVPSYNLGCLQVEALNIMCTIHGIITDTKGKPLNNAVVVLFNCSTRQPILHTLTNEDGLYFFGQVHQGCYYIEAYC